MPTSVRVEDDVKEQLDRLQGLVQSESGRRLTHSELLSRLVRMARQHQADLLADPAAPRPTPEEIRARLAKLGVKGVRTDIRRLDEDLYGERP